MVCLFICLLVAVLFSANNIITWSFYMLTVGVCMSPISR